LEREFRHVPSLSKREGGTSESGTIDRLSLNPTFSRQEKEPIIPLQPTNPMIQKLTTIALALLGFTKTVACTFSRSIK
jgi:hypothetical protein